MITSVYVCVYVCICGDAREIFDYFQDRLRAKLLTTRYEDFYEFSHNESSLARQWSNVKTRFARIEESKTEVDRTNDGDIKADLRAILTEESVSVGVYATRNVQLL